MRTESDCSVFFVAALFIICCTISTDALTKEEAAFPEPPVRIRSSDDRSSLPRRDRTEDVEWREVQTDDWKTRALAASEHLVVEHLGVHNRFWCALLVAFLVFGLPLLCIVTLVAIVIWFIALRRSRQPKSLDGPMFGVPSMAAATAADNGMRSRSRSMLYSGSLGSCMRRPRSPVFEVQPADEDFMRIASKHRLSITKDTKY